MARPLMVDGIATLLRLSTYARRPMIAAVALASVATVLEIAPYFCVYLAVSALLVAGPGSAALPSELLVLVAVSAAVVLGRHLLWSHGLHLSHRAAFAVFQQLQLPGSRSG